MTEALLEVEDLKVTFPGRRNAEVRAVDGHDTRALAEALRPAGDQGPRAIIARTVLGKGVSFMEQGLAISQTHIAQNRINWHYLPLSDAEYAQALAELGRQG